MSLIRRIRALPAVIIDTAPLLQAQQDLLQHQERLIDALQQERVDLELSYSRITRDFIASFLITLDQPENHDDVRHRLADALTDLNDQVARLEEQTR